MNKLKTLLAGAAAALLATMPIAANATLVLALDDLSDATAPLQIVDGGVGDSNPLAGMITYIGGVGTGGWQMNVSIGSGNSILPFFGIDLTSVNITSSSAGTLRVSLTETDLNFGSVGGATWVNGSIGGTTGGSVGYSLFADDTNAQFGTSSLVFSGNSSDHMVGGTAFADAGGNAVNLTDPFSLTLVADISHPTGAATSFDFEAKVPEPGTLALLSAALLGAGMVGRRRKA